MMMARAHRLFVALAFAAASPAALSQAQAPAPQPAAQELPLFVVEIQTGPQWDGAKPAHEQRFFREHSANLKRLRDTGSLLMGARYADKGLVVLAAANEAEARAMMDADASMQAQVFRYELHAFNVFYGGAVNPRPRRPAPP